MVSIDRSIITETWGGSPPAWRNFVRSLQHQYGGFDSWAGFTDHEVLIILVEHLSILHATREELPSGGHTIIFDTPAHKTLFYLKYNGPEDGSTINL